MELQVIGPGCKNCEKMADRAVEAANQLGLDYELEKITDVDEFADYGVMMTPGLAVDGEALISGSVPSVDKIKEQLKKMQ